MIANAAALLGKIALYVLVLVAVFAADVLISAVIAAMLWAAFDIVCYIFEKVCKMGRWKK